MSAGSTNSTSVKRGPYSSPIQQQRRETIIESVLKLLADEGFSGVTVKRVAEMGGVATKTVYNIFGGRDQLLIAAVAQRMDAMQTSERIVSEEPGIPQLLAFTDVAMAQLNEMPDYMRSVFAVVIRADTDEKTAQQRLSRIQNFSFAALKVAAEQGELRHDTDVAELSKLVSANQWGVALMWERGAFSLAEMVRLAQINQCVTLAAFCTGTRKKWLERRLDVLLRKPRD